MNLQAIIVANITGFLILFFLFFSRFITRTKSDLEERAFDVIMYLVMTALIVEPLGYAIDGIHSTVCYWINLIGATYLYFANGAGIFLWLMYVDLKLFHDRSRMEKIYYKLSIPVALLLLSLIGNLKFKYYFYIDENYIYHRQPTVYIFYFYMMVCVFYSILLYFYAKYVHGSVAFFPIYMFVIPILVCNIIQMLFYGVSLGWLGVSLGCVALYMSLQQQKTYLDPLTGIYNRMYFAHVMYKISRKNHKKSTNSYYGIMIDINNFKSINDSFGHSAGDMALKDTANIFNSIASVNSNVFRYAGDEFIILTMSKDEKSVVKLENQLRAAVDEFNALDSRPYKLSFAIGHGKYNIGEDNTDSFFKKIDTAMYEDKKRYHEN